MNNTNNNTNNTTIYQVTELLYTFMVEDIKQMSTAPMSTVVFYCQEKTSILLKGSQNVFSSFWKSFVKK